MPPTASTQATDALFPEIQLDEVSPISSVRGPYAHVALEQAVDKTLTYLVPPRLAKLIRAGQRVRVPLGRRNRGQFGFVVTVRQEFDAAAAGVSPGKLKPIMQIADERVLVDAALMELALWMARYYCCALGLVLDSMIPGAVKKKTGVGYTQKVSPARTPEEIQELLESTKARKRRSLLARLLQVPAGESVEIVRLASEAGVTVPTVRTLAKLGVVSIATEADLEGFSAGRGATAEPASAGLGSEAPHELNADQRRVFESIAPTARAGGFGTHLLLGVTGSGKTEVYLRLIAETIAAGKQAVMLVPEIALTPQTVRRFMARFERVAVLHSGLSAGQRHRYWQQIATGQADVVVGARSAVFAPVPRLGLMVVDEEHESSYKQDTAPRYQARDVAIKRAQLADCPVILGSATPALESYWRAAPEERRDAEKRQAIPPDARALAAKDTPSSASLRSSGSHLHQLPKRVHDRPMPTIELIDMKQVARIRHRESR